MSVIQKYILLPAILVLLATSSAAAQDVRNPQQQSQPVYNQNPYTQAELDQNYRVVPYYGNKYYMEETEGAIAYRGVQKKVKNDYDTQYHQPYYYY